MQYLIFRQENLTIDEFVHKFKELKRKVDPTNSTLRENLVRDFLLRLNSEVKVLETIFRPTILEEAIKSTKNIEAALRFFQSHSTSTPSDVLSKEDHLNSLSAIYDQNSDSKDQRKYRRRCYRYEKKNHEVRGCLHPPTPHRSLQIHDIYPINCVNIEYELISDNLEENSVKKPECIENNSSNKNKYEEILSLYKKL